MNDMTTLIKLLAKNDVNFDIKPLKPAIYPPKDNDTYELVNDDFYPMEITVIPEDAFQSSLSITYCNGTINTNMAFISRKACANPYEAFVYIMQYLDKLK